MGQYKLKEDGSPLQTQSVEYVFQLLFEYISESGLELRQTKSSPVKILGLLKPNDDNSFPH
jgi:hypothetical protein